MTFEFATASRIVFGTGKLAALGELARPLGHRVLLLTGASERAERQAHAVAGELTSGGLALARHGLAGEPTFAAVRAGVAAGHAAGCDLVVACGGGSVLDAGKAIAALLTNQGDPLDYAEVIGGGRTLSEPPLPLIAIPTTAGTGSEVTRNAVLASPEHHVKASLRSPLLLPTVALVDPELTASLPPLLTATTGLDALTQLIEPFVTLRANPLSDAVCREGLSAAARSLRRACEHGDDRGARVDMALASLCGGLALANAGLGAVHGLAAPLGGRLGAPHGAVCAALLPLVMAANIAALHRRGAAAVLARYQEIARILTGLSGATPTDGVAWVRRLVRDLHVPALADWGLRPEDIPAVVGQARQASSMQANPVELSETVLTHLLEQA